MEQKQIMVVYGADDRGWICDDMNHKISDCKWSANNWEKAEV